MTRTTQAVYSDGIFHGLPTFPDHNGKRYTAIVTGANGISGSEIVNVLADAPERWETVYAMSRRPPKHSNSRVKSIAADFLSSTAEELAALFKENEVKADYIFFTSYVQPPAQEGAGLWSNADELETANGIRFHEIFPFLDNSVNSGSPVTLLSNFLNALNLANIIPVRFVLQTGGKHYALHLGPTIVPMTEDTPAQRVDHPNFYFPQEDLVSSWATKTHSKWTVTRPGFILGANEYAQINITYGLAIYASIQRELGLKLEFPSDIQAWDASKDLTTAKLLGYFSEWAALTEGAANEALNIVDDSPFVYGKFWPELARWYSIPVGIPEPDEAKYQTITLPRNPPPRGFGPPGQVRVAWSFEAWAQKDEVKAAWERLQEKEGLRKELDPWRSNDKLVEVFATLDAEMLGGWTRIQTMDKSKTLAWHGHVQSDEGIRGVIEGMVEMKMVPSP